MRKKFFIMSAVSFGIALIIYAFPYLLYLYLGTDCTFGLIYQSKPVKPLVTLYFGIWGVIHQFAAVTSLLIGFIFFPKEK